jgi:hypothetical protein
MLKTLNLNPMLSIANMDLKFSKMGVIALVGK